MSDSDLVGALKSIGRRLPGPVERGLRAAWHRRGALRARRAITPDAEIARWAAVHRRPVSVVIPSYNDLPLLTKCLASLERTLHHPDDEVIVVDDFCEPANSERLRRLERGRVRVEFKERRMGFAVSVNRGMALARHDIVLLNSDIVALPGWIEALQHATATDDRIGLVSARLLYPDGRIQYGGTIWSRSYAPQWFSHRYAGHLADYPPARVPDYNWGASGACLYVTRAAYDKLGGLDEDYWLGFEDVDYAMAAWEAGFRSFYEPRATLIHHESATRGRHQGNRELGSMRLFWQKWSRLHDHRNGGTPSREVDFVVGSDAGELWILYIEALTAGLEARGWHARLHRIESLETDLGADLAARPSLKVAASAAVLRSVWLSATTRGIPIALLEALQERPSAERIAHLKPEFDFVSPNRWTATVLQRTTDWPSTHVVAPALAPGGLTEPDGHSGVLLVTRDLIRDTWAIDVLRARWPETTVIQVTTLDSKHLDLVDRRLPRVVVALEPFDRSLEPLALMSRGAAFVGVRNDRTAFEVLDGLNALLIAPHDTEGLIERVAGILEDDEAFAALRQNGHRSAAEHASAAADLMDLALREAAQRRG